MKTTVNRFFNPTDGTYANVPILAQRAEIFRGRRQFNTDVLVGNWFEDRSKSQPRSYTHDTTYHIDFIPHTGVPPETELRRKLLVQQDERPPRMILGHHNVDDRKQLISSYDEHYNRRGPYGSNRFTSERKWALQDDAWLPEHSDHPLEGEPTRYGLAEKKLARSESFPRSYTLPEISEYADRYLAHPAKSYSETTRQAIPRLFSTELDPTNATNKDINYRSGPNARRRQLTTRDAKEIDYLRSFQRNTGIPRTYYYLGKVPDSIDGDVRSKFPFLPTPLNSLQQITSSTIETLPPPAQSST